MSEGTRISKLASVPDPALANPEHVRVALGFDASKFDTSMLTSRIGREGVISITNAYDRTIDAMLMESLFTKRDTGLKALSKTVYKQQNLDRVEIFDDFDIDRNIHTYRMEAYTPLIKEKNMRTPKQLIPSETINRADIYAAFKAMDVSYADEYMHVIALVQGLGEGEVLTQARNLDAEDLGKHITVPNGASGFMTDLITKENSRTGKIESVLDGKIISHENSAYVIVNADGPEDESSKANYFASEHVNPNLPPAPITN